MTKIFRIIASLLFGAALMQRRTGTDNGRPAEPVPPLGDHDAESLAALREPTSLLNLTGEPARDETSFAGFVAKSGVAVAPPPDADPPLFTFRADIAQNGADHYRYALTITGPAGFVRSIADVLSTAVNADEVLNPSTDA